MSKSPLPLMDVSGCEVAPLVREPLSAQAAVELAGKLKALSDPVRLRLLSVVASHTGGEACVCDLSVASRWASPPSLITSRCCAPPVCWLASAAARGRITG